MMQDPLGVLSKTNKAKEVVKPTERQCAPISDAEALIDVDLTLGRSHGNVLGSDSRDDRPRWTPSTNGGPSSASSSKGASSRQKYEATDLSTYFEPEVGEAKQRVFAVRVRAPGSGWRQGRLVATNFRVRIVLPKGDTPATDLWLIRTGYLDIPWGCMKEIQQDQSSKGVRIALSTKDRRQLVLDIMEMDLPTAMDLGNELISLANQFAWPPAMHLLFAYSYAEKQWNAGSLEGLDGWQVYDPLREYGRMDLDCEQHTKGAPWYICPINKDYRMCESYPSWVVVPKRFPYEELYTVADFRKKNRLPAMSWCAPHLNYAGLFRSSQSTEGVVGQRCTADERLMMCIAHGSGQKEKLLVVDLRPRKTAFAQKVVGGGMEDANAFRLIFGGIENIHHVRTAYLAMGQAVQNALAPGVGTWFQDVAASKWYDLLGTILDVAVTVVNEMLQSRSVLVHCSDGWDRTAQNTSLVMLILDPFYRTFTGFFCLIQKEFCSFGHRFRTRLANGEKATSEYSPIFFQWLDAVYQIIIQNPSSFEFTAALLPRIAHESITNKYGTFLCDTEKEVCDAVVPHTMSVWTELLLRDVCSEMSNDSYIPSNTPLVVETNQVMYKIWDDFWFQRTPLYAVKCTAATKSALPLRESSPKMHVASTSSTPVADKDAERTRAVVKLEEIKTPEPKKVERKVAPPPAWDFDSGHDPFA